VVAQVGRHKALPLPRIIEMIPKELKMADEVEMDVLAESENFAVWRSKEDDGFLYHVELGGITLHLASEEWEEFVLLIKDAD
jgi:hypothetical protein